MFAREGWAQRFVTVQTADEHPSKPHPSMLRAAMVEAGVEPDKTVMGRRHDVRYGDGHCRRNPARWGSGGATIRFQSCRRAGAHSVIAASPGLADEIDAFFARREKAA
ncbi:MAG: hypothetical protein WDN31_07735 [Hyphomicrobium sp.]